MSRTFIREQPENRLAAREERDLARCERPERSRSRRARRLWFVLTGDLGRIVYATVPLRLIADADPEQDFRSRNAEEACKCLDRTLHVEAVECDQDCCKSWNVRLVAVASADVQPAEGFGDHVRGRYGDALLIEGIWIHPDCFFELRTVFERLQITGAIYVMTGDAPFDARDLGVPIPGIELLTVL